MSVLDKTKLSLYWRLRVKYVTVVYLFYVKLLRNFEKARPWALETIWMIDAIVIFLVPSMILWGTFV
jgi:hypothetical protein